MGTEQSNLDQSQFENLPKSPYKKCIGNLDQNYYNKCEQIYGKDLTDKIEKNNLYDMAYAGTVVNLINGLHIMPIDITYAEYKFMKHAIILISKKDINASFGMAMILHSIRQANPHIKDPDALE